MIILSPQPHDGTFAGSLRRQPLPQGEGSKPENGSVTDLPYGKSADVKQVMGWGADEMYLVPTKCGSVRSVARTACLLSLHQGEGGWHS
ncbi:MAG: hypothetical protein LCI00_32570 [Chloroflexi bacterium]|nr:hypothetical protein [Chloroflexota bacterium]MCC6894675.1 hypothetical protein [Anaerolineae bacterium]